LSLNYQEFIKENRLVRTLARLSREATIDNLPEKEPILNSVRQSIINARFPVRIEQERQKPGTLGSFQQALAAFSAGLEDSASASLPVSMILSQYSRPR
jgi:hypothetical protein